MYIGIDLGGTAIKAGIVDKDGNILVQDSVRTNVSGGFEVIVKDIKALIEALAEKANIGVKDLKSVGIGIPGLVDYSTGNVIYVTNLAWENVPLADRLKESLDIPVFVENDANVAALAESLFGSTKGAANSIFLTLGTGIGGGIIVNGQLYSGSHGAGSEIGHMVVGENFYNCNCGNNGCFETFSSATAMIRYAKHLINTLGRHTAIMDKCNGNIDDITAKVIFDAAKEEDEIALEVVNRMIKYLAIGIVSLYNIIDPDIIAIGGGVSKAGTMLLDLLKTEVSRRIFSANVKYGDIVLAELENEAGIIGAAFLGRDK